MLGSAIDIGSAGFDRDSGVGIVMADSALAANVAPSATFTDQPLVVGVTVVKAVHITELRQYVATLRNINGLTAAVWTDPTLTVGSTAITPVHITELRTALDAVYVRLGLTPPTYTTITAGASGLGATYINELRAAVSALY